MVNRDCEGNNRLNPRIPLEVDSHEKFMNTNVVRIICQDGDDISQRVETEKLIVGRRIADHLNFSRPTVGEAVLRTEPFAYAVL